MRDRLSYVLTVAAPIIAIVLLVATIPLGLFDASNWTFDWYQRAKPRVWDAALPIRIVDIDDESLARFGQWPWPRSTIAKLLGELGRLGAAVVAIDVVFAEPDALSAEQIIRYLPKASARDQLEQELHAMESNDSALASVMSKTPTVLAAILTQGARLNAYPTKAGIATAGDDPRRFIPRFTGAIVPLPVLSAAAAGIGAANWLPDRDQIVRRVPLVLSVNDAIVPSLVVEALRVAQKASTIVIRSSNASGQSAFGAHTGVDGIKIGDIVIPTDAQGDLRVRYTPSERRRFISAWKVLNGTVDRSDVEGRIIILGTSAAGLNDQRATPIDPSVAGVEIHAQVVEQALSAAWLRRPDWARGAELALAAFLTLGVALLLVRVSAVASAAVILAVLALIGGASWYQFAANGLLVDPVVPGVSTVLSYGCGVIWLYRDEQRHRRRIREAFARYVAPAVADRIAEDPSKLVLGGEMRTITIMFSDVRGFTAIAEKLEPQALARFINEYLTAMTDIVLTNGGTVDKYIGDAMMAFWNAPLDDPDHASHAVRSALAMRQALRTLNDRWRATAQGRGEAHQDLKFGIGLATGECCVGNFGSIHRFDYSVIGDRVNVASRLERASKLYTTDILALQSTRDMTVDFAWLELDEVRVKGRTEVARIYALAGDNAFREGTIFQKLAGIHATMLSSYRIGHFQEAAGLAVEARAAAPDQLRDVYSALERRYTVLARSRSTDWTPVVDLENEQSKVASY